ncbi:MAG TPA: serine hydrolase [Xanthobacteraceae bacterium]|nr:serine hydrolase [Xanthobacteraceae bacterium]
MLPRGAEARLGLRWGLFSLVTVISVLAISSETSDARSRRKHVESVQPVETVSEGPRYSDIVVDGNSGAVLHASDPDAPRHPASLTKVMTLYLLFEQLEAGRFRLDSPLDVSEHAAIQSPTKLGLREGQTIKVEDAIKGIVTRSANDAAVVVAENIAGDEETFAKLMTRKAQALGMTHTTYRNASGLPNDEQITTARDQALLGRAIQERFPHYYKYFSTRSFEFRGEEIGNHNRLLGSVEGVDGIKTGYIAASGFNLLTSVHRDNRFLVAVVFGGSSASSRDERMRELIRQNIVEASVQHTAPAIAEADGRTESKLEAKSATAPMPVISSKPDSKVAARSETKSAPNFALASAGTVPFSLPSAKPEAKPDTKSSDAKAQEAKGFDAKADMKPGQQSYALASTESVQVTLTSKSDPNVTTTIQVPRWTATNAVPAGHAAAPLVGSEEPIRPVPVKTVMVRAGGATPTASPAPQPMAVTAEPTVQSPTTTAVAAPTPFKTAALPFPPVIRLGTGQHATGPVAEAPPSPAAAAAAPSSAIAEPPAQAAISHPAAPASAPAAASQPAPQTTPTAAPPAHVGWMIQVGAFPAEDEAKQRLSSVQTRASRYLASADPFTETVTKGDAVLYRARFAGLAKEQAEAACNYLKHNDVECMTIKN